MTRAALLTLVLAVCLATATTASASSKEAWYWTPGACKAQLTNYRLQIGSGPTARTLASQAAFCVGRHDRCWLHGGARRYKVFDVTMLAQDDVVRTFSLDVTGKSSWVGTAPRIVAENVTQSRFAAVYGAQAHAAAARENALGCDDPTPS